MYVVKTTSVAVKGSWQAIPSRRNNDRNSTTWSVPYRCLYLQRPTCTTEVACGRGWLDPSLARIWVGCTPRVLPERNFMPLGSHFFSASPYTSNSSSSSGPPVSQSKEAQHIYSFRWSQSVLLVVAPRCQSEMYLTGSVIVERQLLKKSRCWFRSLMPAFIAWPWTNRTWGRYTNRFNMDSASSHSSEALSRCSKVRIFKVKTKQWMMLSDAIHWKYHVRFTVDRNPKSKWNGKFHEKSATQKNWGHDPVYDIKLTAGAWLSHRCSMCSCDFNTCCLARQERSRGTCYWKFVA